MTKVSGALCIGLLLGGLAFAPAASTQETAGAADTALDDARRVLVAGRYPDAERQARAALATLERDGDARSASAAEWLDVLVTALWRGGKSSDSQAVVFAERAIEIKEQRLGPDDPALAASLDNAGVLFFLRGEYERALPLYERARTIWTAASARVARHKGDLGKVHSHLGPLFQELGQYSAARDHYRRALALFLETLGPDHVQVAMTENNLATLLAKTGDYGAASELYRKSLAVLERQLGAEHPLIANSKHNIAELEHRLGRYDAALELYRQAAALKEKVLGSAHPSLALTLGNLSYLHTDRGDAEAAEPLARRAVAIQSRAYGPDHVELAYSLISLGRAQAARGDLDAARATLERALAVRAAALGPDNPLLVPPLHFLSDALLQAGERRQAIELALRAETIARNHLRLTARGAPERQALRYAAERLSSLDLALAAASGLRDASIPADTWDALIRSRAVVLDETAARRRLIARQHDAALDAAFGVYRIAAERLVNVLLRGPGADDAARYQQRIAALRAAAEDAERAVAAVSETLRRGLAEQDIGYDEVRQALPEDATLVAFVRVGGDPHSGVAEPRYQAFVLDAANASPRVLALGAAHEIETAIRHWRDGLRPAASAWNRSRHRRAGAQLRELLWDPLGLDTAAGRLVLIVPAGAIHLVNFSALPRGDGGFLAEADLFIHYLSSERDLVADRQHAGSPGLLVVGAPDSRKPGVRSPGEAAEACEFFTRLDLPPLPGALREARRVASIWEAAGAESRSAVELYGAAATKAAFKQQAPGKTIVHVAAHGFFAANDCLEYQRDVASPLRLSGVVFSPTADAGDGFLLAEEVAAMDLGAADWVVLSGCDTGVGPIQVDEGILGLRRAVRVAGAGTLVMSLWPVEDRSAEIFMTALYEARLNGGRSTAEAMREAYRAALAAARREHDDPHPLYWAPFIASGDWR
ncbi:MAG TPA: CHAT domain-containing tetratricopeptide repeat protein [Woeseiaceae bacterium]|nr:CHAT domain-containing tetratricopeptide repeat protein [Woeseiaceae bacterium]